MNDKLLVVGDMMVDTDVYVTSDGFCRETGAPRLIEHSQIDRMGAAGNAATLAAQIHPNPAAWVSLLSPGSWPNPSPLRDRMNRVYIHSVRGPQYPTRKRILELHTNRVLMRFDKNPATAELYDCAGESDRLFGQSMFDRLLISDYGRMATPLHAGLRDQLPMIVVANVKDPLSERWEWLPDRTAGVCNRYELVKAYRALTQSSCQNVAEMLGAVGDAWGRNLIATCGEDGVYLYTPKHGSVFMWPVPRVTEHPQIVGAGDMFSAALVLALPATWDTHHAGGLAYGIRAAIAAASLYVTRERGAEITFDECAAAMKRYESAQSRCRLVLGELSPGTRATGGWDISDRPIVFTNGCFDLLHAGHRTLLARCVKDPEKQALVVAVNTDESVRALKGDGRPARSVAARKMDVAYAIDPAIKARVVEFDGDVAKAIKALGMRPAELVKGDEYLGTNVPGAELCDKVVLYPMLEGHSTSRLLG